MNKTKIIMLLLMLLGVTTMSAQNAALKPRLVVCTDIAPADVEPDDMESMVHLMVYADMLELRPISRGVVKVSISCD